MCAEHFASNLHNSSPGLIILLTDKNNEAQRGDCHSSFVTRLDLCAPKADCGPNLLGMGPWMGRKECLLELRR